MSFDCSDKKAGAATCVSGHCQQRYSLLQETMAFLIIITSPCDCSHNTPNISLSLQFPLVTVSYRFSMLRHQSALVSHEEETRTNNWIARYTMPTLLACRQLSRLFYCELLWRASYWRTIHFEVVGIVASDRHLTDKHVAIIVLTRVRRQVVRQAYLAGNWWTVVLSSPSQLLFLPLSIRTRKLLLQGCVPINIETLCIHDDVTTRARYTQVFTCGNIVRRGVKLARTRRRNMSYRLNSDVRVASHENERQKWAGLCNTETNKLSQLQTELLTLSKPF